MTKEQVLAFVEELNALSKKHGIIIGGCGCCGSPDLSDLKEQGRYYFEERTYNDVFSADCLTWRE